MKTQRAMRTWHGLLLVCSLLAVLALPVVALAQGGDEATPPVREITDDDVNELSKLLYCPVTWAKTEL